MTYFLGLTGSIGMGKSTTARMFADLGCPVWDADAAVARLYAPGGAAVAPLAAAFPQAVSDAGVNREALKTAIATDPGALDRLEAIVHPLVAADRAAFREQAQADGVALAVLDIPLLFETGADRDMDGVVTVSAPAPLQRQRVLDRPGMTPEQFDLILARQLPDDQKRSRADWVIATETLEGARAAVRSIHQEITGKTEPTGQPHA